jgi:hypothetical protein
MVNRKIVNKKQASIIPLQRRGRGGFLPSLMEEAGVVPPLSCGEGQGER